MIQNLDLYQNQYSETILINNIRNISVHTICITQKNLSKYFISNYILNKEYHVFQEDYDITLETLKIYQPQYLS